MENSKKTPEQLRARALEFTKLADKYSNMSRHASDNAPGSYITGSSGRTKSQNKRTEAALNRTIKYAKLAVYYRARAASLERQAKWNEDKPARDAANAKRLQEDKANARAIKTMSDREALFAGIYPTGIFYADRRKEVSGDYMKLGMIFFETLQPIISNNVSPEMRAIIQEDMDRLISMKGQEYPIDQCGHTVTLGSKA